MAVERHPLVVSGVVGDVLEPLRPRSSSEYIAMVGLSLMVVVCDHHKWAGLGLRLEAKIFAPFILLLVTDIPGSTGAGFGEQFYNWNELVSYESPRPLMGIHRLVLALFQQAARQTVNPPGRRHNFNTREFSQLYDLGSPVAAVYYNCHRENGTGGRRA
ncbi:hypothetical protein DH2020_017551 [Rehmannia glutinosa]|uniref:Uncharacterized protein n=1 Tax=Rehmannia glutinosa TaxID=99300 RepID=A0ABR0WSU0_REHGL